MRVFIAHSGKALDLDCTPTTRVSALQQTLSSLTGIEPAEQILLCNGTPLAANKPLSAYGLAKEEEEDSNQPANKDSRPAIFLYSKRMLQPSSSTPLPTEVLPEVVIAPTISPPQPPSHPLDTATSPLLRVLPQYQRQFRDHLRQAQQLSDAMHQRLDLCIRVVGEMEVQALGVDAALSSVEPHYDHACRSHAEFMEQFNRKRAVHEDVLGRFEADVDFLSTIELPEPLVRASASQRTMLSDLLDIKALKDLATRCARSHRHFAARVKELEALQAALCIEVEAVFMRAPAVDLEQLALGLENTQGLVDEASSVVQSLEADCGRVDVLVTSAVKEVQGSNGGGIIAPQLSDSIAMLEAIHETHTTTVLPRMEASRQEVEEFANNCIQCKNSLTSDALELLRIVSSQQSKMREMKERLAPFPQALARQDADVMKLIAVRRLPAAYKQCLAECSRRMAFNERYAALASDLAEKMGRFRQKEASFRDGFRRHVEGLVSTDMLDAMGLLQQPPHCQVSVPGDETLYLLKVTPDDLRRLQLPWSGSQIDTAVAAISSGAAAQQQQQDHQQEAATDIDVTASLRLENARLRAELASQVALDCIRAAEMASLGGPLPSATSPDSSPRGGTDAVKKFERALSAKDVLIETIRSEAMSAKQQCIAYEGRIKELETKLTLCVGNQQPSPTAASWDQGASSSGGGNGEDSVGSHNAATTQLLKPVDDDADTPLQPTDDSAKKKEEHVADLTQAAVSMVGISADNTSSSTYNSNTDPSETDLA